MTVAQIEAYLDLATTTSDHRVRSELSAVGIWEVAYQLAVMNQRIERANCQHLGTRGETCKKCGVLVQ